MTPEHGRAALPRSCSLEAHPDAGPQTSRQPQMMKIQARAYSQRPSVSLSSSGGARPPGVHAATVEGVPVSGRSIGGGSGKEGWNHANNSSFSYATKNQVYRQPQDSDGSVGGNEGDGGAEERMGRDERTRPRPSSARHSSSRAPLVYKKGAENWSRDVGGDPVQASFFPLLSADDEVLGNDRTMPANRASSNGTRSSPSGSGRRESAATSAASTATPTAGMAVVAAAPAATTTAPVSSPRPFLSKPQQHRERGVSQPLRAHPTPFSPKKSSGNNSSTSSRDGSTAAATKAAAGSHAGSSASGAPPGAPSSTFSSLWSGAGVASAEGPSHAHGSHGHHTSPQGHPGANRPFLGYQLSRSEATSATSSPRVSRSSSSSGTAQGTDGGRESAVYGRSDSGGVLAPPHGGQTLRNRGSPVGGRGGSSTGNRCNSSSSSHDSRAEKTRGDCGMDDTGGGCSGWQNEQGVILPGRKSKSSSTNTSAAGRHAPAGYGGAASDRCPAMGFALERGFSSPTAAPPSETAGRKEGGVVLPGPDGAIEVRELEGGVLVVRRNADEKRRSPERLNLHRRRLKSCPVIEGDTRLRLLNYQNNLISKITNLANLPSLIFIDLYNNLIDTMEGTLETMTTLRVMMIGKNKIDKISNLGSLRKLDVLDLHSNSIRRMEGLDSLQDLRVLNLAGNQIRVVENVSCLTALTELNLRRNIIEKVTGLDALPRLQRLFLSNNRIDSFKDCLCVFSAGSLLELSLDGNPVADQNGFGSSYRRYVLHHLPSLHHLDLKRVTDHDHNQPRAFSQAQHPHSGSNASKPTPTTAASAPGVRENNRDRVGSGGGGGGGNNGSGSARSGARGLSESGRPGATKHFGRPSTTDVTHVGNNSNVNNATNNTNKSSSNNSSDTSTSSRVQEQQHQRWASAKKDSNGRSSEGQSALCRTGVEATISSNGSSGMSRAAEAREAVAAKRVRTEREARERTALKERREAIEAARECWERRGSGSTSSRPRHRTPRHENKGVIGNAATTCGGGVGGGGARGPPSPSPRSPTPPESRRTSAAGHARGGTGSASGAGTLAVAKTIEGGDAGGASVSGFRSRDANSEGKGGGGGGRGRRGGAGVSGGVGYFELEQRISRTGGHDDGDSCGRSGARDRAGDDADAAGAEEAQEGERSSRSRKESGPGITLKVYGDVWRWLGDEKVCSLREKVVEARFSLVHVASVARKAHKIAQTFPNLSCLQMLDNDIRSLKQLERLQPLLRSGLHALHLGRKNPLTKNVSEVALRAWVRSQGCGPTGHLSLEIPPSTARGEEKRDPTNGRGGRHNYLQQEQEPVHNGEATRCRQSVLSSPPGGAPDGVEAPPPPQPPPASDATEAAVAPGPHFPLGTAKNDGGHAAIDVSSSSHNTGRGAGDEDRDGGGDEGGGGGTYGGGDRGWPSNPVDNGYGGDEVRAGARGSGADGGMHVAPEHRRKGRVLPSEAYRDQELAAAAADCDTAAAARVSPGSCGASSSVGHLPSSAAALPTASTAADAAFERLSVARDRAASSSWGAVVFSAGAGKSCQGPHSERDAARDGAGGGNAWAASARGAKLACNLMVRRVCEAHKRKDNFGRAWETTVADIIEDVLTPDATATIATTTTTRGVYGGSEPGAFCSRSPRQSTPPPKPITGTGGSKGGLRPTGYQDQIAVGDDRGRGEQGGSPRPGGGEGSHGAVGVRTYIPRARWLDEW